MNNLLTQKFPIAAFALLFVLTMSCSHDPHDENQDPSNTDVHEWEDSTINGDATMTRMVFTVNDSLQVVRQGQTRATTTVAGVTTFELNDAVTIGITGRGTKDYKVTSILTGALAYDGTATDAYCWQSTSETVSLTAWSYGSTTTTTDPDNAIYTLPTNQSTSYGELLYAAASDYDYASYKSGIPLTLHHQLARLVINLTHLKTGDLDISEIYIGDGSTATIPTTAKFHKPSTGNIGTWGDIGTEKAQITPKTETANACYSAVMIPTTYAAGQKFIVLKTTDSRTYCYIPDADIVLAAGNQYNYTISVKDLKEVSTLTIGDIDPYTYDGTAKEPHPTVTDGSKTLTEGTDYTLSWSNNTNAGTATVTVTGMGGYYNGTQSKSFTINKATGSISNLTFNTPIVVGAITTASISNIGDGIVTYSSGTPSVATVSDADITGISSGNSVITATISDGSNYTYSNKTLSKTLTVTGVTVNDVGKILGANGIVYSNVAAATAAGTTASGIIAYVGSPGSVDTSSSVYKCLVLALTDANSGNVCAWFTKETGTCVNQTSVTATAMGLMNGIACTNTLVNSNGSGVTSNCSGHTHAAARAARNYSTVRPSGASAWFLPTLGQWNLMIKGIMGVNTNLTGGSNSAYEASKINPKITSVGGTGFVSDDYWISTGYTIEKAWYISFAENYGGYMNADGKTSSSNYVRAVFAY